ncbi:FadR/GntR family transcriptional regulator [Tateyamaria pelophila]|uniref:FadR/GntR family transcriptional regulator n=1 Tax=Tateyamaria pelophila TaxID=328415 RepID=UPI001CBF13A8|nr:FCD domain-containing protein [Tateyamaria pelophila]
MLMNAVSVDADDVVAKLRSFIEDGGYKPGDRLDSERELIVRLDVTRARLRKALDTLEHEGAIWRHVGKGTFIASPRVMSGPGNLAILSQQVTPVQLMRARLSLEPEIAREAALNASQEAVRQLRESRDRAMSATTWDAYEAQDDNFHRALAEATENVLLLSLFDHLNAVRRAVAWNTVMRSSTSPARTHSSFAEHDAIVAAVEGRNPTEAHAAMRTHLGSVAARLFGET